MEVEFIRIDVAMVKRGLSVSREKAQAVINSGLVSVNGKICKKPSEKVSEADEIIICGSEMPYVSRGGLKLEKALRSFGGSFYDIIAMDIGASTGGFTDVLLQNGAKKVYAIDVGHGQLDPRIASDPRVVSMEHTNARALEKDMFAERPALGVMDVSFISIKLILPAAFEVLGENGRMISLIKPQFEAGRSNIGKGGIVTKRQIHIEVLKSIVEFVPTLGWAVRALDFSPVQGGDGNIEFLADMVPMDRCNVAINDNQIDDLVRSAHAALK